MAKRVGFAFLLALLFSNFVFAQLTSKPEPNLEYWTAEAVWQDFMATEPVGDDLISLLNTPWEDWSLKELSKRNLTCPELVLALVRVKSSHLKDNFWKILLSQKCENYHLVAVLWYIEPGLDKYKAEAIKILLDHSENFSEDIVTDILSSLVRFDVPTAKKLWLRFAGNSSDPFFNYRVFNIKELGDEIRGRSLSVVLAGLSSIEDYYLQYLLSCDDKLIDNSDKTMIAGELYYRLINSKNIYGSYSGSYSYVNLVGLINSAPEPYRSLTQEIIDKKNKKDLLLEMMLKNSNPK